MAPSESLPTGWISRAQASIVAATVPVEVVSGAVTRRSV
jgi:hypothetical protein